MRILYINNDGSGFADFIEVAAETTVSQLFEERFGTANPNSYLIRVNRGPSAKDQVLEEGDRVSITAKNIQGADG